VADRRSRADRPGPRSEGLVGAHRELPGCSSCSSRAEAGLPLAREPPRLLLFAVRAQLLFEHASFLSEIVF